MALSQPVQLSLLIDLFGVWQGTRLVHFVSMTMIAGFIPGHLLMVAIAGKPPIMRWWSTARAGNRAIKKAAPEGAASFVIYCKCCSGGLFACRQASCPARPADAERAAVADDIRAAVGDAGQFLRAKRGLKHRNLRCGEGRALRMDRCTEA